MKATLKTQLFQYFQPKNCQKGMTQIDWLALIILAVAAVVGLPFLLSTRSKHLHLETEGRNIIGTLNRAQQAYYLEKSTFTDSIPELGLGIENSTNNYQYSIHQTPLAVFHYGISLQGNRKSYLGAVAIVVTENPEPNHIVTQSILCEAKEPDVKPFDPIVQNGVLQCNPSMIDLAETGGITVGQDWEKTNQALKLVAAEKHKEAMEIAETITTPYYQEKILEALEAIGSQPPK